MMKAVCSKVLLLLAVTTCVVVPGGARDLLTYTHTRAKNYASLLVQRFSVDKCRVFELGVTIDELSPNLAAGKSATASFSLRGYDFCKGLPVRDGCGDPRSVGCVDPVAIGGGQKDVSKHAYKLNIYPSKQKAILHLVLRGPGVLSDANEYIKNGTLNESTRPLVMKAKVVLFCENTAKGYTLNRDFPYSPTIKNVYKNTGLGCDIGYASGTMTVTDTVTGEHTRYWPLKGRESVKSWAGSLVNTKDTDLKIEQVFVQQP